MIMNMKGKLALGFMSVCVGAFALSLTSCKNSREMPVNEEQMHEVVTESYLLQEDGTLISFGSESLKAVSSNKGSIEGAGDYYHKQKANITAIAKGDYKLYSFYVKDNKVQEYTEALGTKNVGNKKNHTISFEVVQDVTVVAVFSGAEGVERDYRNLKINGENGNKTISGVSGINGKGTLTAIGEEYQAIKADGKIVDWSLVNSKYTNWEITQKTGDWLTLSSINSTGEITYTLRNYISKNGPRSATFKVGKNGSGSGAQGVWRTVTITQDSYWDGSAQDPTKPIKFVDESNSPVNLPKTTNLVFLPQGENISLVSKDPVYGKKVYAVYQVFKNGQVVSETKKEVKPTFGKVPDWVKQSDMNFMASKNEDQKRSGNCEVKWNVDGSTTVGTSTIAFSQDLVKHNVAGEVH